MLRVGVIGCGGIGRIHAGVYRDNPNAQLVCVCDIRQDRADAAAQQFGVKAYYSVAEMLQKENLDAVSVATGGVENGSDHYAPTMEALEAGVHVLVEKPISNNIVEAREMVAKAKEKGLYLGVNLNHRFVPPAARAKEWVSSGELGELLFINMALWINNPNESAPYFHIRALHPHSIDIMRYFCGDVVKVQAFFMKPSTRNVCWSNVQVNMQFANGCLGHLTGSYDASGHHPIERCEVAGTKGRFVLENVYEELTLYPRESPELRVYRNGIMGGVANFGATFNNRINRWIEQVNAGVPREEIEASGEDGLAAQEIIEAAIKSFETGTVVNVPAV